MIEPTRQDWYCGQCNMTFAGTTRTDRCSWCLSPVQDPKAMRLQPVEPQAVPVNGAHP